MSCRRLRAQFGFGRPAMLGLAVGLAGLSAADVASGYTTRVHIMLANKIHDALAADGETGITLWQGGYRVVLPPEDAQAILEEPAFFRAGAIGPDNMVFPGMTDPSHAVHQRPFEQCERLYQAAILPRERAYALGCFLHGSTDAIAHHYVNFMSGETFTLNPITANRQDSFDNVVRHIVAEEMIQDAAFAQDPASFTAEALTHEIPHGFLLRTYFDPASPVYELMGAHAVGEFDAAKSANPGASLPTVLLALDVAPADHLVLAPIYIREIDQLRFDLRDQLEADLAVMQNWNTPEGSDLLVTAGDDGELGTKDDETDCVATCAQTYIKYFLHVGLLEPRYDASGNPLPPAYDKISDKFGEDLQQFLPALVQTVENVSQKLNGPLGSGESLADLTPTEIDALFTPMTDWADAVTTVDSQTLAEAVSPEWLLDLEELFQNVGINISIAQYIEAIIEPLLAPIEQAIEEYVIGQAKTFVSGLVSEYQAKGATTKEEYLTRLSAALPAGLAGTSLDYFFSTGLYGHSFNITAAAISNHAVVLPVGEDPVGVGPASFDCSYTAAWMQAGLCPHLSPVIFPMGIDVVGALSVRLEEDHVAQVPANSPVECHGGQLASFSEAPSSETCALTTLDALLTNPYGSISRAHPPEFSSSPPECMGIVVEGLPPPQADPTTGAGGGGNGDGAGGSNADEDDGGCGCRTVGSTGSSAGGGLAALVGILAAAAWRRRRRPSLAVAGLLAASLVACGDDSATEEDDDDDGAGGTPTTTTGGAGGSQSTGGGGSIHSPLAEALLAELGQSTWSGLQTREGKTRAYEIQFDATTQTWGEIRNPFGPARDDLVRGFVVADDGVTVTSVQIDPDTGEAQTWTFDVIEGTPRRIAIGDGTTVEEFQEGAWPAPTSGLTADVRVFSTGSVVPDAFCTSGLSPFNWPIIFDFARGSQLIPDLGTDRVAGAPLLTWHDVDDLFAVTDVEGFDPGTLGGTELSDQNNFFVWYRGTIQHPGGTIEIREGDDEVEDGVIVLLGDDVGTNDPTDQMFFVHGFVTNDDEVEEWSFPAGDVPIEIIMIRCNVAFVDVDVEMALGGGPFLLVGDQPTTPEITEALFPSVP